MSPSRFPRFVGGDEGIRTLDPLLAGQVLSQLSYTPILLVCLVLLVGSSGFEPPTSRLSGARSNQLSYEPSYGGDERVRTDGLLLARQALSQLSYTPMQALLKVLCTLKTI